MINLETNIILRVEVVNTNKENMTNMRRTLKCIVCGMPATSHTGHVHLPEGTKIISGLCDEHKDYQSPPNNKWRCTAGCDGDYKDWMLDSKKETQSEMWAIVDRQSLQDSMDQFILKRK